MQHIVLTQDQARVVAQAQEAVEIRDPQGKPLGVIDPKDVARIAESRKRLAAKGPRIPGAKVQAHLQALQKEWDRTGGFDEAYMHAFLDKLRVQE